jgi:rubrerythrin
MPELKGSNTERNLRAAFSGESEARDKYTYYASQAKKDGYEQIAAIFQETADNEKEHAKLWFKALHGGAIGPTAENLRDAAAGEHYEWSEMYKEFAEEARREGFGDIAFQFERVAGVEAEHEKRYLTLLKNIKENLVFKRGEKVFWICRNCGHIHEGAAAPEKCPVCAHPKAYFQLLAQNY